MEGKSDQGGGQGLKILTILKKNLFDLTDSSSHKSLTSREICSSFIDLVDSVCNIAQRPNSGQLISQTVELLVHACSSQDHHLRLAASENLKKLMKVLMFSHLSRIQQDLFHELKKNGTTRSLCVALDCFSALFPLTRPSKCSSYAQSLLPILVRLTNRQEEALHEALQGALTKILPTMTPFLSTTNLQFLMSGLVNGLPIGAPSYRRMASSALVTILLHCNLPNAQAEWLISKLLAMGCDYRAKSETVQGVLLIFQQLFTNIKEVTPSLGTLKQAYCFLLSCLLYRGTNTSISALECLHQLLLSAIPSLTVWLTEQQNEAQVSLDYWVDDSSSCGTPSDNISLGEGLEVPCDSYFENNELVSSLSDDWAQQGSHIKPHEDSPAVVVGAVKVTETSCLVSKEGSNMVLESLINYLLKSVLNNNRVSAQSLGLACVTAAVDLQPSLLLCLDPLVPFTTAQDPKLRSRAAKLLAMVISAQLRTNNHNLSQCPPLVNTCCELLVTMLEDDTSVVLKAVCEALQQCLPHLVSSTRPEIAVDILHKLLPFRESSYWLTKVELLQTLGCLDFTSLAVLDSQLPEVVLNEVIFPLLGDVDHRVRAAVCQCLVQLAPNLDLRQDTILSLAKYHSSHLFLHLYSSVGQLSLAGIGDSMDKRSPKPPLGLEHLVWFLVGKISSSKDTHLQLGCMEALKCLCEHFPPPSMPDKWGCNSFPCTLLNTLMQLLRASKISWGVQAHGNLLEVITSVFLACALSHLPTLGKAWLEVDSPVAQAPQLLSHVVKLLSVFVHVIEEREPELKEKKLAKPVLSPKKPLVGDPSPNKPKSQPTLDLFQKPPLVPRDGLGLFANSPQLMRVYDACKAAYSNYKLSLESAGTDKFSKLLQTCHNSLAALLEIATATDIGKYVEEILGYITYSIKVDPSGGILCVQQLLNALFGLNVAAQHTHLHSPYVSSLPYNLATVLGSSANSVYAVVITEPLDQLFPWLHGIRSSGKKKESALLLGKKALLGKPANSVSSIKDYIGFFEPLVVHALGQFSVTSSTVMQQRVLFLLVQLLNLKVRYELLDCHHTFLDSVVKLISLMETGVVKGGETLVPHLFQFLVLLAYDQSKLISIPEVMQKCDGVMASGHNVLTFAIPALQPLVLNLFVRPARETPDLETQREVVMSMLLRLIEYSRVVNLLTHVLDCYKKKKTKWLQASNQIFAALLPQIGKLRVVLDNSGSLVSLYQLLTALDPSVISVQALFTAILKPKELNSVTHLIRWLGFVCTLLELMASLFNEQDVLNAISFLSFTVPSLSTIVATVDVKMEEASDPASKLSSFLQETLCLATSTLNQLITQRSIEDHSLLSFLVANLLLLLYKCVTGAYSTLRTAFESLPVSSDIEKMLSNLATMYPLLTLLYINFTVATHGISSPLLLQYLVGKENTGVSSKRLLQHTTLLLLNQFWLDGQLSADPLCCAALAKSPALLYHCQIPGVKKFIKFAQEEVDVQECLVRLIKSTDITNVPSCVNVVRLASSIPCMEIFKYLCFSVIPSSVTALRKTAENVAIEMLDGGTLDIELDDLRAILIKLSPWKDRCIALVKQLEEMCADETTEDESVTSFLPSLDTIVINKEWFLEKVKQFCCIPGIEGEVISHLLGSLDEEDVETIIEDSGFPLSLLESCVSHGVFLYLNKDSQVAFDESIQLEFSPISPHAETVQPLLQVSVRCLIKALKTNKQNSALVPPMIRLLAARHQVSSELTLDNETVSVIIESVLFALSNASEGSNLLILGAALDYCTLLLSLPNINDFLSENWICIVVSNLSMILVKAYPVLKSKVEELMEGKEHISLMEKSQQQLVSILSSLLGMESELATHSLGSSLRQLTLALCRLPLFHEAVMTPAALKTEGKISTKVLDQALMESEILVQFMQRGNFVGWLSRQQFEERWMQVLGVVNQPPPQEGEFPEEYHAYTLNVCAGVQAVTSLLLSTLLRPNLGDPTTSVPMHTHRSNDLLFLGTRPGRKLSLLRKHLEQSLLLQYGKRSSLFNYYQSPIQLHVASLHYPPLYSHNIERELGDTDIGVGQLSLNSLWPVMLVDVGATNGLTSDSVEVDIKSCIISLIELYTHWLANPIHTLQLQYTLQSVVMLSDLFAVSSQVEWMLGILLDMYDRHPMEDVYSISFIVLGILKAAAILKLQGGPECEKIAKIVEKSLVAESPPIVQSACVYGLLYLAEDLNSSLISQVCSAVTKFISGCLLNFQRYTDRMLLGTWSLAVSVILKHSNHVKDQTFISSLLEQVSVIMHHSNTSFALFHCFTLGLELLVLNFSLSAEDRKAVSILAANRFGKCEQAQSLSALALLVTCMYTGEAANVASVPQSESFGVETTLQAREQINSLMERLGHDPYTDIKFLVDILPDLIVDFLPLMEVLQTVVTAFVSPHQTRPELAASVLNRTFLLLMRRGEQALVNEWVLLSLESFVQQEPKSKAIWSITCLLASATTNELVKALSKFLCLWTNLNSKEAVCMLCSVARTFYFECLEQHQQKQFLSKFKTSQESTLRVVADYCELS